MRTKLVLVAVTLFAMMVACAPNGIIQPVVPTAATPAAATQGTPVKIGVIGQITGAKAFDGASTVNGVTMAVEEINSQGGIMGHPLQIFVGDGENTAKAVSAARQMFDVEKIDVLLSPGPSGDTLAVMPVAQEVGVPMLTSNSTNRTITEQSGAGGNDWQFRMNPHDGMMIGAFSAKISKEVKSISLIGENNDFGRGVIANFKSALSNSGTQVTSEDFFDPGQPDFRPMLTKIKGLNPEAVLIAGTAKDAANIVRQLRELGMTQRIYARGTIVSVDFIAAIQDNLGLGNGIQEATSWSLGVNPDFDNRYKARFGTFPPVVAANTYAATRFVLAQAIENAIKTTGKADRTSIRDALKKVSAEGFMGPIQFDDHNQAHPKAVITQLDDKGNISILEYITTQ